MKENFVELVKNQMPVAIRSRAARTKRMIDLFIII